MSWVLMGLQERKTDWRERRVVSLLSHVWLLTMKKISNPLLQRRSYKTYSAVGRNTNCLQTLRVPNGHIPMYKTEMNTEITIMVRHDMS
jgi:hypothetical protein